MKSRKFWAVGGARAGCAPPKSATADIMHSGDSFSLTDKMWLIAVKRGTAYLVNTTVHKKTGLPQIDGAPCLGDFKCKQISTRPRASGEIFITGYGIDVSKASVNLKIPGTHHRL